LVVGVTVRLLDTRTGEVVTTATGNGVATRSSVSVGGLAFAPLGGAGGFSRGSARFRDAQLAEAIERSIGDASAALANTAPRLVQERQR
jgi:curli biogenesis system outer membrane secretion channel CsgG